MPRLARLVRTVVQLAEKVLDEPQPEPVQLGCGGYADWVYIGLLALREATTATYVVTVNRVAATPSLQAALGLDEERAGPPSPSTVCEAANRLTATVVWSAPQEVLITTTDESAETLPEIFEDKEEWHMTGLLLFADYGLEFFTAGPPPNFHSEVRDVLTPVDFILHTLLLDADTRNLSYCALLLIAADVSSVALRSKAPYYDVSDTVDALITFVETQGDTRQEDVQLPDWSEWSGRYRSGVHLKLLPQTDLGTRASTDEFQM